MVLGIAPHSDQFSNGARLMLSWRAFAPVEASFWSLLKRFIRYGAILFALEILMNESEFACCLRRGQYHETRLPVSCGRLLTLKLVSGLKLPLGTVDGTSFEDVASQAIAHSLHA